MKDKFRSIWNAFLKLIYMAAKTILPEDCSMERFVLTAYLTSWIYLTPIIYGIYTGDHPRASAVEAILAAFANTIFVAIAFTPVSIGLIFVFLLLASALTGAASYDKTTGILTINTETLNCPSVNSEQTKSAANPSESTGNLPERNLGD